MKKSFLKLKGLKDSSLNLFDLSKFDNVESNKKESSLMMYLVIFFCLIDGLAFGLVIGWTSPAIESMQSQYSNIIFHNLAMDELRDYISWIGSSMALAALVGSLISDLLSQKFGCRKALMISNVPFTLGWMVTILSNRVHFIIIGRAILGFSTGLVSGTIMIYIGEMTTGYSSRSIFGACFQLSITIGIVSAYIIGAFVSWRVLSAISMIPTLLVGFLMIFMPTNTNWSLMAQHEEKAVIFLIKSISNFTRSLNQEQREPKKNSLKKYGGLMQQFQRLFRGQDLDPLYRSISLMFFQQFSGINVVLFYSTQIFSISNSSIANHWSTTIIGGVQVLASAASIPLILSFQAKTLLSISGLLQCFGLMALGVYFIFTPSVAFSEFSSSPEIIDFVPLICVVVFIAGFSIGWGPIPWFLIPEMVPLESQSAIIFMSIMIHWLCAFLVTKNFLTLILLITEHGAYFLFAGFSLLSIVMVATLPPLPEAPNENNQKAQ